MKMVLVMVWGGFASIGICSILYSWVNALGIKELKNVFGAMIVIGPVEEAAKFIALASSYIFIRKDLNEPTDGLIYMSCVAVGFSLIENYFYATRTPDSGYLLFLRLLICTPGHILFSAFMGIAFYQLFRLRSGIILFLVSFLYACVVHGLWDSIVFSGWLMIFLFLLIKITYSWTLNILSYTTAKSPFRITLKEFIESYEGPSESKGLECLNCGSRNDKITYKLNKIEFQKCDNCSFFVAAKEALFGIFKFFGSIFKTDISEYYRDGKFHKTEYSMLHKGSSVSDKRGLAFFELDVFNNALIEVNDKMIENFENHWWFPNKFRSKNIIKARVDDDQKDDKRKKSGKPFIYSNAVLIPLIITFAIVVAAILMLKTPSNIAAFLVVGFPFIIILFGVMYAIGSVLSEK